jgi:hypothetical protein
MVLVCPAPVIKQFQIASATTNVRLNVELRRVTPLANHRVARTLRKFRGITEYKPVSAKKDARKIKETEHRHK